MKPINCLTIEPALPANACVIWIHGLGGTSQDSHALLKHFQFPKDHRIRFIFPQAPVRPISLNAGGLMPGWYDIYGLAKDSNQDEPGILESARHLHAVFDAQIASGIPSERILVGGFSQGSAMTLYAGLTYSQPFLGLIPVSGYLPLMNQFRGARHPANHQTPILMAHGTQDLVVHLEFGELSHRLLTALNYPVEFHTFPVAHYFCEPEIRMIQNWVLKKLQLS